MIQIARSPNQQIVFGSLVGVMFWLKVYDKVVHRKCDLTLAKLINNRIGKTAYRRIEPAKPLRSPSI